MSTFRSIPQDSALSGLDEFAAVRGAPSYVVEAAAALSGLALAGWKARRTYVRYWPGRRCVVQWTFSAPGQGGQLVASAELLSEGVSGRSQNGEGTYLEDRRVWLRVFPHDSVLPAIATAASEAWIQERLVSPLNLGEAAVSVAPVGYKSWRRCVLEYSVTSNSQQKRFFAKLFRDDRGEDLFRILNDLNSSLKAKSIGWTIPKTVFYDRETRMLVTAELENATSLSEVIRHLPQNNRADSGLQIAVEHAGSELARFQGIRIDGLEVNGPEQIVNSLIDDVADIESVEPVTGRILRDRVDVLGLLAASLAPEPLALSHGAFRHSHVYQTPGGLAFLDLDNLRMSGVNADAGYFLGYLAFRALKRSRTGPILNQCGDVFEAVWLRQEGYDPQWLSSHYQAVLLKWAIRSFFRLRSPGRSWCPERSGSAPKKKKCLKIRGFSLLSPAPYETFPPVASALRLGLWYRQCSFRCRCDAGTP